MQEETAQELVSGALIFAADPVPLLEAVWQGLIADRGKLLSRLMGGEQQDHCDA
jgi:hypothetical protein